MSFTNTSWIHVWLTPTAASIRPLGDRLAPPTVTGGAPMQTKVTFTDIDANWEKWGLLVSLWIKDPHTWPKNTDELLAQMNSLPNAAGGGTISGANVGPFRTVQITQDNGGALQFLLPSQAAVDNGLNNFQGNQPYPLGSFYDTAFNTPPPPKRRPLLLDSLKTLARMRIGEYTILECQ
jgi:hypothetical protein